MEVQPFMLFSDFVKTLIRLKPTVVLYQIYKSADNSTYYLNFPPISMDFTSIRGLLLLCEYIVILLYFLCQSRAP